MHCLKFIKYTTTRISSTTTPLTMAMKQEVLGNAMTSCIVYSPSPTVRSFSLSVFKNLLCLLETECKRKKQKICRMDGDNPQDFRLQYLSLLISLIPVGRQMRSTIGHDRSDISIRCSLLFDFVISYITNAWSNLKSNVKQRTWSIMIDRFRHIDREAFTHETLCDPPKVDGFDQLHQLLVWVITEIKFFTTNELNHVDSYFEGLISILQNICIMFEISESDSDDLKTAMAELRVLKNQSFMELLFRRATFIWHKDEDGNKLHCTAPTLRKKLLDFLLLLCKNSEMNQLMMLQLILTRLYSESPRKDLLRDWNVDPVFKQKGYSGHVGMKNQGATCYMNSLLQQFFHTPTFRNGLMSCKIERFKSSENLAEGHQLLFELQRLFGNLLMSEKRDFDTIELVKTIQGYDGEAIRPGEQQDVDEFFNLFCTRLETALKDLPQKRLLHDVFGGQTSHLITCKECQKNSERIEDFLSISLDVKGKHNLFDSLQSYIRGEVLDGANKYFCSYCDGKQDSIKRCCIKTLP